MSLITIILFSRVSDRKTHTGFYVAFVVMTLALSWLMTNVTFAYRYAHEYYTSDKGDEARTAASIFRRTRSRTISTSSISPSCSA